MRELLTKLPFVKAAVTLFVAAVFAFMAYGWWSDHKQIVQTTQCQGITLVVNDSTQAQCARLKPEKGTLEPLQQAAKQMGGKLVAGVEVRIKPETLFVTVHDAPTTTDSVGTRHAVLDDTTKGYKLHIDAEAPPAGNLKLGYKLETPEFKPEVGFVKRADGYYAVVSANGQKVETAHAFFTPEREKPLSLRVGADVRGNPMSDLMGVRGSVYGAIQYERGTTALQLQLGTDGKGFIGLRAEKKIW